MRDLTNAAKPEVLTLQDLVHRLTLRSMADPSPRNIALFTRALQDAIRTLPGKNAWTYYKRRARVTTSPSVTCVATYDHTGGAHERLLTITSAHTWPADAVFGKVVIGSGAYRILKRISNTLATLQSDPGLTADFTGTSIRWQRSDYTFSREITRIHAIYNCTTRRELCDLPLSEYSELDPVGYASYYTLKNSNNGFGTTDLSLYPCPSTTELIDVVADINPLMPRIYSESGTGCGVVGDVATSAGSTFTSKLIGAMFRISRDTTIPTGFDSDNYDFQAIIIDVPTATTLKLSDEISATASARGFSISSPIDIDAASMLEYLEDEAYSQYTKNHDHKSQAISKQLAMSSLREAIARDNSRVNTRANTWYEGFFYEGSIT